jgi:hypothetical protein
MKHNFAAVMKKETGVKWIVAEHWVLAIPTLGLHRVGGRTFSGVLKILVLNMCHRLVLKNFKTKIMTIFWV